MFSFAAGFVSVLKAFGVLIFLKDKSDLYYIQPHQFLKHFLLVSKVYSTAQSTLTENN